MHHMATDWDDLRFFVVVARVGSVRKAALALAVNHTTVARRIGKLEHELGTQVFKRSPKGYSLTPAGEDLKAALAGVEQAIQSMRIAATGRDAALQGTIRIAVLDALARILAPLLSSFMSRWPAICIELTSSHDLVSLTRREADVAIRYTNSPPDHLVGRNLGTMSTGLYGHQQYIDCKFDELPWIAWDASFRTTPTERWIAATIPDDRIRLRVDSMSMFEQALAAGVGVGFFAKNLAAFDPMLSRLSHPHPSFETPAIWILTHPALRSTAKIRTLMAHLGDGLANLRANSQHSSP